MNEEERLQILEMIEKGVISASEGVRLLNSLQGDPEEFLPLQIEEIAPAPGKAEAAPEPEAMPEEPSQETKASTAPYQFDAGIKKWRRWYWVPLAIGIFITVVSGLLMFLAYRSNRFGFWFACLWFPLLFGILVMSLAAASRTAHWLHVRVKQAPGERPETIVISFPIPIRLTAWVLRTFKPRIPGMDKASLDEAVLALGKITPDQPFYVKVDEGESGEGVEVFIG